MCALACALSRTCLARFRGNKTLGVLALRCLVFFLAASAVLRGALFMVLVAIGSCAWAFHRARASQTSSERNGENETVVATKTRVG
eukprot:1527013-Alexandrium_andersonii.AAC.1